MQDHAIQCIPSSSAASRDSPSPHPDGHARKRLREEDQTEDANKRPKNTTKDPVMLATGLVNLKISNLDMMSESLKALLTDCAILAMKDHAIRNKGYRRGLRFVNFSQVRYTQVSGRIRYTEVSGHIYKITFEGVSKKHGVTTYEAVVWDSIVHRKVECFRTKAPRKDDWKSGVSCIPLISITDASSSDNKSNKKAIVRDCAILAMQDHAIQESYCEGLRFIKLLKYRTSLVDGCNYFYSITFLGASHQYGEAVYKAYVWDCEFERKVEHVKIISPPLGKCYAGKLSVPKVACLT